MSATAGGFEGSRCRTRSSAAEIPQRGAAARLRSVNATSRGRLSVAISTVPGGPIRSHAQANDWQASTRTGFDMCFVASSSPAHHDPDDAERGTAVDQAVY